MTYLATSSCTVDFVCLELVDRHLPVVDCDKVDELSVVLNVDVTLLNLGLEVQNVLLLARLAFPE